MRKDHIRLILISIFLVTLIMRLYFSFQTTYFSEDQSYFLIRQAEYITENSVPMFYDSLSYGGRLTISTPLYYYVLAFFNLFLPITLVGKLIPNIFAASLVFIVYLLSKQISKNEEAALFTAFISGFIPIFLKITINNISLFSLVIPLTFLTLYFFIKSRENKNYIVFYLLSFLALCLTHSSTFLFIVALMLYLFLSWLEKQKITKAEVEITIFSLFFLLWSQFLIYKNAFLEEGPGIIWQNIPSPILSQYFAKFNLLSAIVSIGLIPFLFGIYIIYRYLFKTKNKEVLLFASFALSVFLLLWLRLIEINIGLAFLGIVLVILFSYSYKLLFLYTEKTRFSKKLVFFVLVFIFIIASIIPSFEVSRKTISEAYTDDEISAFEWLRNNTPVDSTVVATVREGGLINYVAERRNVIDSNFLFAKNAERRLEDVKLIYTTFLETDAITHLNKYNISYIVLSDRARELYDIRALSYTSDTNCFELVYNKRTRIYKSICKKEEIKIEI